MPVLQTLNHTMYVKLCYVSFQCKGAQIYHTSRSNLKILRNIKVTWSKFYAQDKHVLGATLQNLVTWTACLLEHVYPHFSDNVTKVPTNHINTYLCGIGPRILSIMARCSLLSWVWNNVIPRYNSKIIHPMDQTSHGCDHPSSEIQIDYY
jgi:hypothetical protein